MIKNIARTRDGVNALIDHAHDAVVGVADRAELGVESTAERVIEKAQMASERVQDGADTMSREARRGVRLAARAVDHGYTRFRDDLSQVTTAATGLVAEHPGKALLLAATAGFVLGALWRRAS